MAGKGKNQKFWDQVLDEAEKQGIQVLRPGQARDKNGRKKKSRHTRVTNLETGEFCFVANTPSDYRTIKNCISLMRGKVGFVWNGH